ncbi:hypothetical protein [Alteromonas flava]|uniref:hypothetical protein n=1 Tax=Alteromonas flava TaxID=2048003 RepID=UPI000F5FA4A1|nr:hypothetical protein [Alteromonas flava]
MVRLSYPDLMCSMRLYWQAVVWFFASVISLAPSITSAQTKSVTVAGAHWPGFVEPDGSGTYLDPLRTAFQDTHTIRWDISEFERARRLFLAQRADILVGVYRTTYPDKLYPKAPIDIENELRAFYLPEKVRLASVSDIDGKLVAWRNGYQFEGLLDNYTSHLRYDDVGRAFALLESGKIEVILDYAHNLPESLRDRVESIIVLPKETLWVVFQNTPRGQQLLAQYEAALVK